MAALDVLAQLPRPRTAILGDMLELGSYEEEGHREVGRRAARGPRPSDRGRPARPLDRRRGGKRAGWPTWPTSRASDEVDYEPRAGEHILVKGSRSMRMENVVARLRAGEAGA